MWSLGSHVTALPGVALLVVFVALPMGLLAWAALEAPAGGVTTASFADAVGDPVYRSLLLRSLRVALEVVVISLAIGWPVAWALAKVIGPRWRTVLLSLAVIPYLTSQLLLIYSMLVLLAANGPLMNALHVLGLADASASIDYTPTATLVMLVYESVPTVILVMYSACERLDDRLLEAARSLGAPRRQVFLRVVWPLSVPATVASLVLVFVQTAGAFAESAILGGPSGQLIGNAISDQIQNGGSRAFASALALTLLAASLLVVAVAALAIGATRRLRRVLPAPAAA